MTYSEIRKQMNDAIRTIAAKQGVVMSTVQRRAVRRKLFAEYKKRQGRAEAQKEAK